MIEMISVAEIKLAMLLEKDTPIDTLLDLAYERINKSLEETQWIMVILREGNYFDHVTAHLGMYPSGTISIHVPEFIVPAGTPRSTFNFQFRDMDKGISYRSKADTRVWAEGGDNINVSSKP